MDTASTHSERLQLDSSGALLEEIPCRHCGYLLRGLSLDARCPECGAPVRDAATSDLLSFSDPRWLERLARGCGLIFAGAILWGVTAFMELDAGGTQRFVLWEWLGLVPALINVTGYWLVTAPETGRPPGRGEGVRVAVRFAAVAYLIVVLARIISFTVMGWEPQQIGLVVGYGATMAVTLLWIVETIAHFGNLARRLSPRATRVMKVLWALPVTTCLLMAAAVFKGEDLGFGTMLAVPCGALWLTWLIVVAVFGIRFRQIATANRAITSSHPPAPGIRADQSGPAAAAPRSPPA